MALSAVDRCLHGNSPYGDGVPFLPGERLNETVLAKELGVIAALKNRDVQAAEQSIRDHIAHRLDQIV